MNIKLIDSKFDYIPDSNREVMEAKLEAIKAIEKMELQNYIDNISYCQSNKWIEFSLDTKDIDGQYKALNFQVTLDTKELYFICNQSLTGNSQAVIETIYLLNNQDVKSNKFYTLAAIGNYLKMIHKLSTIHFIN